MTVIFILFLYVLYALTSSIQALPLQGYSSINYIYNQPKKLSNDNGAYNKYTSTETQIFEYESKDTSLSDQLNQLLLQKILSNPKVKSLLGSIYNQENEENISNTETGPHVVNNYILVPADYMLENENYQVNTKRVTREKNSKIPKIESDKGILNNSKRSRKQKTSRKRPRNDKHERRPPKERFEENDFEKTIGLLNSYLKPERKRKSKKNNKRNNKHFEKILRPENTYQNENPTQNIANAKYFGSESILSPTPITDKKSKKNNFVIKKNEPDPASLYDPQLHKQRAAPSKTKTTKSDHKTEKQTPSHNMKNKIEQPPKTSIVDVTPKEQNIAPVPKNTKKIKNNNANTRKHADKKEQPKATHLGNIQENNLFKNTHNLSEKNIKDMQSYFVNYMNNQKSGNSFNNNGLQTPKNSKIEQKLSKNHKPRRRRPSRPTRKHKNIKQTQQNNVPTVTKIENTTPKQLLTVVVNDKEETKEPVSSIGEVDQHYPLPTNHIIDLPITSPELSSITSNNNGHYQTNSDKFDDGFHKPKNRIPVAANEFPHQNHHLVDDYYPDFTADYRPYFDSDEDLSFNNLYEDQHYFYPRELSRERRKYERYDNRPRHRYHPRSRPYYNRHKETYSDKELNTSNYRNNIIHETESEEMKFQTPPTLEVPDFKTKKVTIHNLKDNADNQDHQKDNLGEDIRNFDRTPYYSKVATYPQYNKHEIRDEFEPKNNLIETVFANSKVAKYGHNSDFNGDDFEEITWSPVCYGKDKKKEKNGGATIVYAKSYPEDLW